MSASKLNLVSFTKALSIVTCMFLAGCGSSGSEPESEPGMPQTADVTTTAFDGTWQSNCHKLRYFGLPEDAQPDGYVQRTLTIDSSNNYYSERKIIYTDSQCVTALSGAREVVVSGEIIFDGLTTTRSGLEATIVRYFNNGTSPDYTGLLYRDGDVLYRDPGSGTVIMEDVVPDQLILVSPWQLIN